MSATTGLEICLEEATQVRGYLEKATSALTPAAAWEPTKNVVEYPLPPRRPPVERARSPTGGGGREPPPTPPAADRSTAKGAPPSDCHWRRSASPPQATTGTLEP